MQSMFGLAKNPTPGLVLLLLIPAFLILSYFSFAHSPARITRPEPGLNTDLDHLRTFNDRENFRRWFTWVAEMQFYNLSDEWNTEQRDCAGLVSFAFREALRPHDRPWFQRLGENYLPVAPDLNPQIAATLAGKFFRTADGHFSEFVDALTLKQFNVDFVGRDRSQAKPGDLLFFHQPWVRTYPYLVMIFLGEPRVASEGTNDWVVYHTGEAVKKVRLAGLDQHPDKRSRPIPTNPNFLGFFRLKILDQRVTPEE